MNYKYRFFSVVTGIFFAVVFAYLAFNGLDFSRLQKIVMSVDPMILVVALALYIFEHVFRLIRWWWMMRKLDHKLSLTSCVDPYLISISANHLVPIRIGDLIRVFTYQKTINIQPSKRAGVIVVERFIDFLVFLIFFYVGLMGVKSNYIPKSFIDSAMILAIISSLVLLVVVIFSNHAKRASLAILDWKILKKWSAISKVREWVGQFFDSLATIGSPWFILKIFFFSFLLWFTEAGMFLVLARAVDPQISFLAPIFAFAVGALSSVFPTAPGMIGTLDYFLMLGVLAYGMSRILAASFAILVHAYFLLSAIIIGLYYAFSFKGRDILKGIFLLWNNREKNDLKQTG